MYSDVTRNVLPETTARMTLLLTSDRRENVDPCMSRGVLARLWFRVPGAEYLRAIPKSPRAGGYRIFLWHLWRKGLRTSRQDVGVDSSQFLTEASGSATHACQERAASRRACKIVAANRRAHRAICYL